jgi:hypothetical protein
MLLIKLNKYLKLKKGGCRWRRPKFLGGGEFKMTYRFHGFPQGFP